MVSLPVEGLVPALVRYVDSNSVVGKEQPVGHGGSMHLQHYGCLVVQLSLLPQI